MIVWCSYCQQFLREKPPLTDFSISHGLCATCATRIDAGEPVLPHGRALVDFYRDMFTAASAGDVGTCARFARRGAELGMRGIDLLLGLVQPVLEEIGRKWENGEIGFADEHRFTGWCRELLCELRPPPVAAGPLQLLIVPAPGNDHDLGPRVAAFALAAHGLRVAAECAELAAADVLALARGRQPAWLGISCAQPADVARAREVASQLHAGGFAGRVVIGGQALRRGCRPEGGALDVCLTIDDAVTLLRDGRPPR
jgi:methanogenic corrinoid protein MtbC1